MELTIQEQELRELRTQVEMAAHQVSDAYWKLLGVALAAGAVGISAVFLATVLLRQP
jgi:hypothetical protein